VAQGEGPEFKPQYLKKTKILIMERVFMKVSQNAKKPCGEN
jgi:hypothetical protein